MKFELMQAFYLVRHGETVANAQGVAAGSVDTPLTNRGRAQARAIQDKVEKLMPAPGVMVHSGLIRAFDTAQILNEKLKLPVEVCPLLAEQDFGDWAGEPFQEVLDKISAGQTPPNGEAFVAFTQRVLKGLSQVLAQHQGLPIIVTHGGVFDALLTAYGQSKAKTGNCAVWCFNPTGEEKGFPWRIHIC